MLLVVNNVLGTVCFTTHRLVIIVFLVYSCGSGNMLIFPKGIKLRGLGPLSDNLIDLPLDSLMAFIILH